MLALTLSLALSFSSVLPAFSQEPADDHAYTLTKIEVQDPSNLPANTITKYEWSETENKLTPVYYRLDLKQTDYGHTTDYDEVKTFTVTTPNVDNTGNAFEYEINYYVNNDRLSPDRITTNQNGADIDMDFVGLKHEPSYGASYGGAIYNYNNFTISDITGDFIGNYVQSTYSSVRGGAIYNYRDNIIGNITGNFIGNYASTTDEYNSNSEGGAIYNSGEIGDITGDFIGNYVYTSSSRRYVTPHAYGGAIYNTGTIGNVTGDFIGNYAKADNGYAYGGAIYSPDEIGDITGDFIGNYAHGNRDAYGGAIYRTGNATVNITGDFIGNYAKSDDGYANGGAIYSAGEIGNITGVFISNYANGDDASGGAIYNEKSSTIGYIEGDFIGNYTTSHGANAFTASNGGAIANLGAINSITGDFIGNYALGSSRDANGGAIYNDNDSTTIDNISGDFIGNYISGSTAYGGAVYNAGKISNITGNFIGNYAQGSSNAHGGAIANNGTIDNITGNFIENYVKTFYYSGEGGAIINLSEINDITGDFTGNYVSALSDDEDGSASGGAIHNSGLISNITGNFTGNYAKSLSSSASGGAITNYGTIGNITGNFIGNFVQAESDLAQGGAIANYGASGSGPVSESLLNELPQANLSLTNSSFFNNYAKSQTGTANGGAIYTNDNLNITAKDGGYSVFSGNYTESNGIKTPNAIYVESSVYGSASPASLSAKNDIPDFIIKDNKVVYKTTTPNYTYTPVLTLNATNNGTIIFDDQISGSAPASETTYSADLVVTEDAKEYYGFSNIDELINYTKTQGWYDEDTPDEEIIYDAIEGGILIASNEQIISSDIKGSYDLKLTGDTTGKIILNNDIINANISLDNTNLYLGRENVFDQSQSLSLNSGNLYLNNNSIGTMHIPTLNLNGNTNLSVDVDLANKQMDRITADNYNINNNDAFINVNNINLLSDSNQQSTSILFADEQLANNVQYTGSTPIAYSPIYKYDVSYSTNPEDNLGYFFFNRASSSSGNQSDAFNPAVLTPSVATQAGAYTTQLQTFNYAFQHSDNFMLIPSFERISIINNNKYALAQNNGVFSPLLTPSSTSSFWVKPYASFESIPLNNGPTVSNINYGTLIGYDSNLKQINNGWSRVLTGYIGYNGASQRYQGVDAYQNGGLIGATTTFYKGNFFNATTISAGASVGDATTMYGSENYTMLMAGIGNKFGYNFEFKDGKYILQPAMLLSYSFINTFDYNNAAGLRIESDPLHAIQLSPGIKFIMNTKSGWQPYLAVNMTWNILDETKVTANDVRLPSMSIDPYVSYGAGIQKRFNNDRFTAFGQTMIHNGGRNGISLTAGFRWRVGKD